MSSSAETPAPNRWPRGSIMRAFGNLAAALAGMALGIDRHSWVGWRHDDSI